MYIQEHVTFVFEIVHAEITSKIFFFLVLFILVTHTYRETRRDSGANVYENIEQ